MAAFRLGQGAQARNHRLLDLAACPSTNAEALRLMREGESGPLWIVTAQQDAGRGRRQRPWAFTPGNLAATFLLGIEIAPARAATLGFVAGVAMQAALQRAAYGFEQAMLGPYAEKAEFVRLSDAFRIKWPNDLLGNGAKLAGILLECEPAPAGQGALNVVVGMGINVVQAPSDTPYPATSLAAMGLPLSAEDVFEALSNEWAHALDQWDFGNGMDTIRARWMAHAAGLNAPVIVENGGRRVTGLFEAIDIEGRLIVAANGTRETITAGDVFFGNAGSASARA